MVEKRTSIAHKESNSINPKIDLTFEHFVNTIHQFFFSFRSVYLFYLLNTYTANYVAAIYRMSLGSDEHELWEFFFAWIKDCSRYTFEGWMFFFFFLMHQFKSCKCDSLYRSRLLRQHTYLFAHLSLFPFFSLQFRILLIFHVVKFSYEVLVQSTTNIIIEKKNTRLYLIETIFNSIIWKNI